MVGLVENTLGAFLKARRERLSAPPTKLASARRRTPGLRREEVAERANISAKWYTFLEQGRGGAPSAEVLHRLSGALELSTAEREHLFHLVKRPGKSAGRTVADDVTPTLRRLLDAMEFIPAFVKTPTWDIVAWNRAAAVALTDYGALAPDRRNLLRLIFARPEARATMTDWERHARFAVAAFRLETGRNGPSETVAALVKELSDSSPEFAAMWRDQEVGAHGEGTKQVEHPAVGTLKLDYATFAVDGRPDLGLVVFTPATPADLARMQSLLRR